MVEHLTYDEVKNEFLNIHGEQMFGIDEVHLILIEALKSRGSKERIMIEKLELLL